ncbi:MAG: hypothetical protein ACPGJV_05940 [Bacteriovoracaceae bacterium]
MKYIESLEKIESLFSEGKLGSQNVEVIFNNKKFFIHHIDFKADQITLKVDRSHFIPWAPEKFLTKLKDVRDMVSPDAVLTVGEDGKSDSKPITSFYCSDNFLEIVVE